VLNPLNIPDEWEYAAIQSFIRGKKEVVDYTKINGEPFIRIMRPMITKKIVLKMPCFPGIQGRRYPRRSWGVRAPCTL